MNISGGKFAVDLTRALSYLTGSHVPQGSTVKVVGLDYDSPANNADSATESMYLGYYPTTDKLVHAWRNAFAAHCNAKEDLLIMNDIGEFIVGWNTSTILHPGATPTGQSASGTPSGDFEEEIFYNWAPLAGNLAATYNQAVAAGSSPTTNADARYFCNSRIEQYEGVVVGSYQDNRSYTSKFALGGDTQTGGTGPYTAKISIIDAFNKANPVLDDQSQDPFGYSNMTLKKYGNKHLQDLPMVLKIQTGMSTHFTLPVGGIDVMCGLLRLSNTEQHIMTPSSAPDETGAGSDGAQRGTLTVWVSGWTEF